MKIKHRRIAMPGGTKPEPVRSSLSGRAAARVKPQAKIQKTKYQLPPLEQYIPYKP